MLHHDRVLAQFRAWLKTSLNDERVAVHLQQVDRAAAAFHFQQAAEKLLASALLMVGQEPTKTGSLACSWHCLARNGVVEPADYEMRSRLNRLSLMSIISRYPALEGTVAPSDLITEADVEEAAATCRHVFDAVFACGPFRELVQDQGMLSSSSEEAEPAGPGEARP